MSEHVGGWHKERKSQRGQGDCGPHEPSPGGADWHGKSSVCAGACRFGLIKRETHEWPIACLEGGCRTQSVLELQRSIDYRGRDKGCGAASQADNHADSARYGERAAEQPFPAKGQREKLG